MPTPNREPNPLSPSRPTRPAFRVAAVYALSGLVWIVASDALLARTGEISAYGFGVAVAKGAMFVLLTSGLVFWLVARELRAAARGAGMLRAIAEGTDDAVFVKDRDGKYLLINTGAARLVGKTVDDVLGRDDTDLFDPAGARAVMDHDRRVMETGRTETEEAPLTAGGVTRTYLAIKTPYRDGTGAVVGVIGYCRDVTEARRAERALRESAQRFRDMADAAPVLIWLSDTTKRCVWFNRQWLEFVGRPLESEVGDGWADGVHPEDRDRCWRTYSDAFDARQPFVMEYRLRRHDGEYRWLLDSGVPWTADGGFAGYIGSCVDITDRRRMEENLRASEERLVDAQGVARLGSWSWDPTSGQVWWSDTTYELFGLSPGTVVPSLEAFLDRLHPDDRPKGLARAEAMLSGGTAFADDLRVQRPDGTVLWIHSRARVTRGANGRVMRVEGTDQDITDRKRAERDLRESEERFRAAMKGSLDAVFFLTAERDDAGRVTDFRFTNVNDRGAALVARAHEAVVGQLLCELLPINRTGGFFDKYVAVVETGLPLEEEFLIADESIAAHWLHHQVVKVGDGIVITSRDVTDRKRAEQHLRESEERLRLALAVGELGTWDSDVRTGRVVWSDAHYAMHGYAAGEVPPSYQAWLDRVHPDDRSSAEAAIALARANRTPFGFEFRALHPDGTARWLFARGRFFYDETGEAVRMVGVGRDVTEQKEAERALRLARFSIERAVDAMFWVAPSGEILYANEAAGRILGYAATELVGLTVPQIDPDFPADAWPAHWDEIKRRGSFSFESNRRTRDGRDICTEVTVNYIRHEDREYNCAVLRDITARKRAEGALRESEDKLRTIFENEPECVKLLDRGGRVLEMNPAGLRMIEADSLERVRGAEVSEVLSETDRPRFAEMLAAVFRGENRTLEFEVRGLAGTRRLLETHSVPLWDADRREVRALLGVTRDVTERRRAEDQTRASEERLRLALIAGRMGTFDWDIRTGRVVWSESHFDLWGYPPEERPEVSYGTYVDRVHPDDRDSVEVTIRRSMRDNSPYRDEYRIVLPNGTERWISGRGEFQYAPSGDAVRMLGTVQDVTDRKRAELAVSESERRYRELADAIPQIVWTADREGGITHLNVQTELYTGRPAAELTEWKWGEVIHPDDLPGMVAAWTEVVRTGVPKLIEFRIRRADGAYRWHIARERPAHDGTGARVGWYGTCTDVEDLKVAETALRASEEQLKLAIRATGVVIWDWDVTADAQVWRTEGDDCFGWRDPLDRPQPAAWRSDRVHPDDRTRVAAGFGAAVADPTVTTYRDEYRFRRATGEYADVLDHGYVLRDPEGRPVRAVGAMLDVTARRRAEEALRESEERYRRLVEVLPTAVLVHDGERVTFCNPAFVQLIGGASAHELIGSPRLRFVHPEYHEAVRTRLVAASAPGDVGSGLDLRLVRLDGRTVLVHAVGTPIQHKGRHEYIVAMSDLSERERATDLLKSVMGSVSDAIVTIDTAGTVTSVNPATERMFDYAEAELLGRNVNALMPEPDRGRHDGYLTNYLTTGIAKVIGIGREVEARRKDGKTFPVELTVTEFRLDGERRFTGVLRDISARRRLEEQFRQSQKMEAVGRLAGGIAHDFNNLLTVINGYGDLLLLEPGARDDKRDKLVAIRDAGERAAALTSQLLAFSRKTIIAPKAFDLRDTVAHADRLLRRLIGEDILLTVTTHPAVCRVFADPNQIDQVLLNIAVNARDAMPKGGRLTLEVRPVAIGASAGPTDGPRAGRYIELSVSDTGCGMSDEVRANIFEPFFTTKGPGKGTGLGLATVYGIVQQAGGHIAVESAVGRGTTFRVWLPAVAAAAAGGPVAPPPVAPRGTETVLLVEDDDAVRTFSALALEGQGYRVLVAESGPTALPVLSAQRDAVRLLVTDVVMPEMSGRELADAACALVPGLKVLFVSGYTDDAVVRHGVRDATDAFLQKPFTPLGLARKVRELLDGAPEPHA